ncbi:hypothetical protein D3C76_1417600 [compost metagenome]
MFFTFGNLGTSITPQAGELEKIIAVDVIGQFDFFRRTVADQLFGFLVVCCFNHGGHNEILGVEPVRIIADHDMAIL